MYVLLDEDASEIADSDFEDNSTMDIQSPIVRYKGSVHQNHTISPSKGKEQVQVSRMEVLTNMYNQKVMT